MARKAFTLIELLVVVSIIALLLAILMPALSKVKAKAAMVSCKSNLRQITLGTYMYADQNSGRWFPYGSTLWISHLAPYVGNLDSIRYCAQTRIKKLESYDPYLHHSWGDYGTAELPWRWRMPASAEELDEFGSYAINGWLYWRENLPSNQPYFKNANNVEHADLTPAFADSVWVDAWPRDTDTPENDLDLNRGQGNPANGSINRFLTNRHGKKTDICFVDGHVETIELPRLWQLYWNVEFKPWQSSDLPKIMGDTMVLP